MEHSVETVKTFIEQWPDSSLGCRQQFIKLAEYLGTLEGVSLEFVSRPDISYSLRAGHRDDGSRPLFAMVDVIDADPRWLSVCFYAETVADVEQRGNVVPNGLLGEDGLCFDIEDDNSEIISYIISLIDEANKAVSHR